MQSDTRGKSKKAYTRPQLRKLTAEEAKQFDLADKDVPEVLELLREEQEERARFLASE